MAPIEADGFTEAVQAASLTEAVRPGHTRYLALAEVVLERGDLPGEGRRPGVIQGDPLLGRPLRRTPPQAVPRAESEISIVVRVPGGTVDGFAAEMEGRRSS